MPTGQQIIADVIHKYRYCKTYHDQVEVKLEVPAGSSLSSRCEDFREIFETSYIRDKFFRLTRTLEIDRRASGIATVLWNGTSVKLWCREHGELEGLSLRGALSTMRYEVPRLLFGIEAPNLNKFQQARIVGTDAVNERQCYRLEILPIVGYPCTFWVAADDLAIQKIVDSYQFPVNDPSIVGNAQGDRFPFSHVWFIRDVVFDGPIDVFGPR